MNYTFKGRYVMVQRRSAGVGMTPSTTPLGAYIRARRLELGLKHTTLSEKAKMAQTTVSMLEVGERKGLSEAHVVSLAEALQCDSQELRDRLPQKPGKEPVSKLGKLIRTRREELGLSLPELA